MDFEFKGRDRPVVEVEPYSMLARYYDDVMDHIEYRKWADYILKIARKHNRKVRNIIDFACGTGTLAFFLMEKGYDVTGVDGASGMIEEAKRIKVKAKEKLKFYISDLREVPMVPKQDLGLCLYDSLNYLMEEEDVFDFFAAAKSTIQSKGTLIIDLSTIANSQSHFDGYEIEENVEGGYYKRKSYYDTKEKIQHNLFDIYPDGKDVIYFEHHRQRIWPVDLVTGIMEQSGFKLINIYHEMTLKPGSEKSNRVHIIGASV